MRKIKTALAAILAASLVLSTTSITFAANENHNGNMNHENHQEYDNHNNYDNDHHDKWDDDYHYEEDYHENEKHDEYDYHEEYHDCYEEQHETATESDATYEEKVASSSDAEYETPVASGSDAEYQIATPSQINKEKVSEPTGLYWDEFVANWDDVEETDCEYLVRVKVRSSNKVETADVSTVFNSEDLEEVIQNILDTKNMAGLNVKVSFRVMAMPDPYDEEYCDSNWSDWSDAIELEQEREELEVPSNLTWDSGVAMWDSVEHASGYYMNFIISNEDGVYEKFSAYPNTNSIDVRNKFDVTCKERNLANGIYNVIYRVEALGGNTGASAAYVSSDWSDWSDSYEFTYGSTATKLETPAIVLESNLTANWTYASNAYDYYLNFRVTDDNGFDNIGSISTQETTRDLTKSVNEVLNQFSKNPGEYSVSVRIMARARSNSAEFINSDTSEWTDPVDYTYGTIVTNLTAPTGLYWNGYNVAWDAVDHADYYTVNYSLNGNSSWTVTTGVNTVNLEHYIKESSVRMGLPAGSYDVSFRVMSNSRFDNASYRSSDYSAWLGGVTYTIAADINRPTTVNIVTDNSSSSGSSGGASGGSGGGGGGGGSAITLSKNEMDTTPLPSYVETTGSWTAGSNGSWTYSNNGVQYKDTTVAIQNGTSYAWYRFDNTGLMVTGWYTDPNGNVYYYSEDKTNAGMLITGTHTINGVIYEFAADGKLVKITY